MKRLSLILMIFGFITFFGCGKDDDSQIEQPTSGILSYIVESDLDTFEVTYKGMNGETLTESINGQNRWQYDMQTTTGQQHFVNYSAISGEFVLVSIIYNEVELNGSGCAGSINIPMNCNVVAVIP